MFFEVAMFCVVLPFRTIICIAVTKKFFLAVRKNPSLKINNNEMAKPWHSHDFSMQGEQT